ARSYATVTFKHQSQGADVCTTTHCQAWSSTHYPSTSLAVTQTSKFSIKHNGNIIEALFFGNCNGVKTKNNESVWGGSAVPYLRSKSCGCGFSSYFGHGVGMCQQGDRKFANEGMSWENIIKHYYTGVTIDKPNTTPDPVNNIPVLNTPAAGASVPSPVNMTWSTSVSGAACRIQVSKVNTGWTAANGFTTETAATANVPVNYSTPGLLNYTWPNEFTAPANRPVAGSTYYWTVRSYSAATGTSSYSPVRSFRISTSTASERLMDNAGFTVYSDAARKEISINFSAAAQKATISLFDISGNQIFEKSHAVQKGANSLKESVAGLKEGVYILMLNDGEKVSTQNIIIQ
ncbi:MAG TPA: T9SS type A sorting domain-containing protein, partial [Flavobacterium sp.]|nr:T9SS type A sorting domain-containing protein [Flavobacterium sp.]